MSNLHYNYGKLITKELQITSGATNGYILTSDAIGNASWQPSYTFTGNTSGDCITDLFVSNIHSCSPLNINPLDEGNVYFGSTSGVTIDVINSKLGVGVSNPTFNLDVVSSGGTGSFEDIARFRTIDSSDYLTLTNAFSTDGTFNPVLRAFNNTNVSPNFYLQSVIDPSVDTGVNPLIILQGRVATDTLTTPVSWSGVTVRPILSVRNNNERLLDITSIGNVGIGTTTPSEKLEVNGKTKTTNFQMTSGGTTNYVLYSTDNNGNAKWGDLSSLYTGNTSGDCITNLYVSNLYGCSPLHIEPSGLNNVYMVENGGSVGIGINSAASRLTVSGNGATFRMIGDDHSYLSFYPQGVSPRFGFIGYGSSGSTDLRVYNEASNGRLMFGTNGDARMTILDNGNIGVGVSLSSDIGAKFHINNTTTGATFLAEDSSNPDSTPFIIDTLGNVGIGTSSPTKKLDVNGTTIHRDAVQISAGKQIYWEDNTGVWPTSVTSRLFWDINNDSAEIYAYQPATDDIDFVFKITDNSTDSRDNYVFWIDDNGGEQNDRYPLEMNGLQFIVNPLRRYATIPANSSAGNTDFYVLKQSATTLSQSVMFADVSTTRVGINTSTPSETLDVNGNTKISGSLNIGTILGNTPIINLGLDSNGNVVTGTTGGGTFTGNTSGDCITDLYVTNLYGCSPITVNDSIQSNNSSATGTTSFAFGNNVKAYGNYSTASGYYTKSSGDYSHAEGGNTTSSGDYSHSEGYYTTAFGYYSHAEGQNTKAIGVRSHAEGFNTTASGSTSHAEGGNTITIGANSHAEGGSTTASGDYSHSEGRQTTSIGNSSHAEGIGTIALANYQHVSGLWNLTDVTQGAFIVGNGTNSSNRSNLMFAGGNEVNIYGQALVSGSGQNILTVIGSGDTSPLFTVQGSSGELFSVTDNLIGSLFSVNDISGLPILEVFSDDTILMGSFQAPSLNTTVKLTPSIGQTTVYSIPISAYTGAWFEYTVKNTGGVRAGQIMSVFSGTSVQSNQTTTSSIGSTTPISFTVTSDGTNASLKVSATTSGWEVKTIVRSI